jgi:hypothetical protein
MKRLLSRKTKPIAFGHPIHFAPIPIGQIGRDLARNALEVTRDRGLRTAPQTGSPRFDLTFKTLIDRIRNQRRGLGRGLDHSNRMTTLGDA